MKMRVSFTKGKDCIYANEGKFNSDFLSHQLLCWQLGRLAAHISTLFLATPKTGCLLRFVVCLKSGPRETRNLWGLRAKRVDSTGHLTSLKVLNSVSVTCVEPENLRTRGLQQISKVNAPEGVVLGAEGRRNTGSKHTENWADEEATESFATVTNFHCIFWCIFLEEPF